jgi:hypothetical protein
VLQIFTVTAVQRGQEPTQSRQACWKSLAPARKP